MQGSGKFTFDYSKLPKPAGLSKTENVTITASRAVITTDCFGLWDGKYELNGARIIVFVKQCMVTDNGDGTFTMPRSLAREKGFVV